MPPAVVIVTEEETGIAIEIACLHTGALLHLAVTSTQTEIGIESVGQPLRVKIDTLVTGKVLVSMLAWRKC